MKFVEEAMAVKYTEIATIIIRFEKTAGKPVGIIAV